MLPVRARHLDHRDILSGEVTGQARTPRAGAFDTDRDDLTEGAQPAQQLPVAGRGRRELCGAEHPAEIVERGGEVGVLVGVDTAGDAPRCICHRGHSHPFIELWMARTAGHGQASDGAPARASIRSRSTNWLCRWRSAHRADGSARRHRTSQAIPGSDPTSGAPPPFSLAIPDSRESTYPPRISDAALRRVRAATGTAPHRAKAGDGAVTIVRRRSVAIRACDSDTGRRL